MTNYSEITKRLEALKESKAKREAEKAMLQGRLSELTKQLEELGISSDEDLGVLKQKLEDLAKEIESKLDKAEEMMKVLG